MRLPFTTSPRVVVDLYREGVIGRPKARTALETLAVAGRYARDIIAAALVALLESVRSLRDMEDDESDAEASAGGRLFRTRSREG